MNTLMRARYLWHNVAAKGGLQISLSTAYRLVQAIQVQGEVAFQNERQGHPAKLLEGVLQWLQAFCRATQKTQILEVQAALQEQFRPV